MRTDAQQATYVLDNITLSPDKKNLPVSYERAVKP
jgi:hypothetical protein